MKRRFAAFPEDVVWLVLTVSATLFFPVAQADLAFEEVASTRLYDRNGYLLREVLSPQAGRGHWVPLDSISDRVVRAAIAAEDRRFRAHRGVDGIALFRAAWQNVATGRVVSGGSTITQQLVRNLYHFRRQLLFKAVEMWYAVRLESTLTKEQILEQYLNRIPFGNQTFGVEAAARLYLGKSAFDLTWSEAAFLMALPKSPTRYNPYRQMKSASKRRVLILRRLRDQGCLDESEFSRAVNEPALLFPRSSVFGAPHFTDWLLGQEGVKPVTYTSLDLPLQEEVETIVSGHVARLRSENVSNAAILVVHNATGQILALTGSADYFDSTHDGQFNAVFARRQPGSALKPFTYALAFTASFTPASILADMETIIPTDKGTFTPRNYDNRYHGPVRARMALACSYNIPAVRLLQDLGVPAYLNKLRECGLESLDREADYYGHGLTLGNGEVSLYELARAYTLLANGGRLLDLTFLRDESGRTLRKNVFPPDVCFLVTDILSDEVARAPAFGYDSPLSLPFPCAVKSGTSSDFRDNWTVGYTREYTVAVWAGNFDNKPMRGISGITGAGPIFHDVMIHLHRARPAAPFEKPAGLIRQGICSLSGQRPGPYCRSTLTEWFRTQSEPEQTCRVHGPGGTIDLNYLSPVFARWQSGGQTVSTGAGQVSEDETKTLRITFPGNNAGLKIDPSVSLSHQAVFFEALASPGVSDIRWYLNGRRIEGARTVRVYWKPQRGNYRLKVTGNFPSGELADEVEFEVE
jgi:penicillin-binding protein 1C